MSDLHGRIHWTELMTRDVQGAIDYYTKVCGWSVDGMEMPEGMYYVAKKGDDMVAGMMNMAEMPGMEDVPPHWFSYIAVDDVDKAVDQTRSGGGTVMREPWDVGGVGRIAIIKDPTGAAIGLMTPSDDG
ncbi:VOC family protein [Oceanomicrobium pacificus]|uniref:VOC family protein n=1 Tax=Oceanomicrobium pacificus TaxID=2692916 RepID=A0A6B0TJA2_9RHOB|nr:VOC family protein [Oceanomicrobium pacificus]MXU64457.1 VOC family protein [Oceanomicrobium pacificus]